MTEENEPGIGHNKPPIEEVLADTRGDMIAKVAPLAERATALKLKAITSEDELESVLPIVREAKALAKELDAARVEDKAPSLAEGRAVDAFFADHLKRSRNIVTVFERFASDFQREKAMAERRKAEDDRRKAEAQAEKLRKEAEDAARPQTAAKRQDQAAEADDEARRASVRAQQSASELGKFSSSAGKATGRTFWNYRVEDHSKIDLNALRDFIDPKAVEKAIKAKIGIQKGATKIEGVEVFEDVKTTLK